MTSERLTLGFCCLTLIVGTACFVFHFSPVYIAIPAGAAVVCYLRHPVRALVEIFFGGRR